MLKDTSLDDLLNEMNDRDRDKIKYLFNFYSRDHILYNLKALKDYLENISIYSEASFQKELEPNMKRLVDNLELRDILSSLDNVSTYFSIVNTSIHDIHIFLTSYTDISKRKIDAMISASPKYKKIIEDGILSTDDIYTIIKDSFNNQIASKEDLDIDDIENSINASIKEKVPDKPEYTDNLKIERKALEADFFNNYLLEHLSANDIKEAFARQGNIRTKDFRILATKVILGEDFKSVSHKTIEKIKGMLSNFNMRKITENDINLFKQNKENIINKGFDIDDIFYVKNMVSNEEALEAFSRLPENLQEQFLKVNIISTPLESFKVLNALTNCKTPKIERENFDDLQKNLSRIPKEKREEILRAVQESDIKTPKTKLDIDPSISFGFELEVSGISTKVVKELASKKPLTAKLKETQNLSDAFTGWTIESDGTVPDGLELISPIIYDTEKDWHQVKSNCEALQALGAETDYKCGGHIHIGSNILGTNEDAWKNFFKMWSLSEPLLYKISNKPKEDNRETVKYEFAPTKPIIDELLKTDSVKINNYNDVIKLADAYTRRSVKGYTCVGRGKAMNLQCIAEGKQSTIEFRIPNGNIDFTELQRTAELYARMLQTSRMMADYPDYKKDIFEKLEKSQSEDDKIANFLDLIFDNTKDKAIFYERFYSHPAGLVFGTQTYEEIIDNPVEVNTAAKYEWRGTR